jgi:hypothetical protein
MNKQQINNVNEPCKDIFINIVNNKPNDFNYFLCNAIDTYINKTIINSMYNVL